ncbi:N-acetylneuraminate synthase family protein [Planctomycetota bacterium]|nr:N-acetylneuraminate synthase family protein [Planctomycetota bacterium]
MESATQIGTGMFKEADQANSSRTFVIAEIGVNHDGDMSKAIQLVKDAKTAGADAVKFQLFNPDRLLSNQAMLAGYQAGKAKGARELLAGLMLSVDEIGQILAVARDLGLKGVVTPFSLEDVVDLEKLDVDVVKIASPDAVNEPLLQAVKGLEKPLLISTGTCELDELEFAAELIRGHVAGGGLLQCVSSYPTPMEEAGLGGIGVMRDQFSLPIGYSDHTRDVNTGAMAVCAGAVIVEKHLTYDCRADGPDHAASMDGDAFCAYVKKIREAEVMMGARFKGIRDVERDVRLVSRQSVCAAKDLKMGDIIGAGDLTVRRPGDGVAAKDFEKVIGRKIKSNKELGDLIYGEDVAW